MNFKELPDSDILTQKELAGIPDIEMNPVGFGTGGGTGAGTGAGAGAGVGVGSDRGGDQRYGNTFVGTGSESSIPDHGPWDGMGEGGRQIMVRKDFTVESEMGGVEK